MMQVIPAVNTSSFSSAKDLINKAVEFLPADGWIHLDIGDGIFSSIETWGNIEEFQILKTSFNTEVHLMVVDPINYIEPCLNGGAKRVIAHLETLNLLEIDSLLDIFKKYHADLMLAMKPETKIEQLNPFLVKTSFFQVLAVPPGKAGQGFQNLVLNKVAYLREKWPDAKIEVDGGINLETAKLAKDAGADILVSASYIYDSDNPKEAFTKLSDI